MTGRRGASFFSLNTGRATLISSDVGKTKTGGRVIYVTWTTKQKDAFFLKRCSLFKPQQKSGRDMCELRNRPRSLWSLCGSVIRASKRGIRRCEVRFLMETQNFFFVPRSWQGGKKYLTLFLSPFITQRYVTSNRIKHIEFSMLLRFG